MSGQASTAELESPDKIAHQRREWLLERVGWSLIAVVLAAGLLGALGPGLLGTREAASRDGALRAKYSLVERYDAPNVLELWLTPKTTDPTLEFSQSFMDAITVEQFVPAPASSASRSGRVALRFHTEADATEHKIICRYKHNQFGLLQYEIVLAGHGPLQVQQLVVP